MCICYPATCMQNIFVLSLHLFRVNHAHTYTLSIFISFSLIILSYVLLIAPYILFPPIFYSLSRITLPSPISPLLSSLSILYPSLSSFPINPPYLFPPTPLPLQVSAYETVRYYHSAIRKKISSRSLPR